MPTGRAGDYHLNDKPFMLARGDLRGRAWKRVGTPDTAGRRSTDDRQRRRPGQAVQQPLHPVLGLRSPDAEAARPPGNARCREEIEPLRRGKCRQRESRRHG